MPGASRVTCAEGALLEMCAELCLVYTREIGDGDGSGIPGVPACVLVPRGSADKCARVWRPACTQEFGYDLIEGEVFGYGISRLSERPGGT